MTIYKATHNVEGEALAKTFTDATKCANFIQIDVDEMLWAIAEEGVCETDEWTVTEEEGLDWPPQPVLY